ncbi:hypothetical protein HYU93_00715 [Candidatus Daviesbacteria bacterium]|nr:hypothetical protein [Candidatus Daviesbacteria bacterium]
MKFSQKLTTKQFIFSHFLIFVLSLMFLAGLYYIINIQYQRPTNLFLNGPVTTPPKSLRLDLDQPDQDSLSYSSTIIVSGQTAPSKEVLISTDNTDSVIESKQNGSFSTIVELQEGVNRITAVVFDATGDSRSTERTVYYSKEKL